MSSLKAQSVSYSPSLSCFLAQNLAHTKHPRPGDGGNDATVMVTALVIMVEVTVAVVIMVGGGVILLLISFQRTVIWNSLLSESQEV